MSDIKKEIIGIGRLIWDKNLTYGLSGNISVKVSPESVLITGHGCCLGELSESDIGEVDLKGEALTPGFKPSSEKFFHVNVYKHLDAQCVIHVHPSWVNGYFAANDSIDFDTIEMRLSFGNIPVVDQKTPAITDITPVIDVLKKGNLVVLKHHGVVALGLSLKDAFFLIQMLEEAVKVAFIKDFYSRKQELQPALAQSETKQDMVETKKYQLFSSGQIKEIVNIVNHDEKFRKLSEESSLKTKLAVVLEEDNTAYCFDFCDGKIKGVSNSIEDAEFVITGKAEYWRAIFNRELDPFVATTQKKLKLKGDFAKISRWYVPFNRLFDLWKNVPVE